MRVWLWCFRPLAGLSCINQTMFDYKGLKQLNNGFRPLAGLSCINRLLWILLILWELRLCFRPLAGLSCINLQDVFSDSSMENA